MAVILAPEERLKGLGTPDDRKALLRSFPAERMECWPIGKAVGNVRNEGPELVAPIAVSD